MIPRERLSYDQSMRTVACENRPSVPDCLCFVERRMSSFYISNCCINSAIVTDSYRFMKMDETILQRSTSNPDIERLTWTKKTFIKRGL